MRIYFLRMLYYLCSPTYIWSKSFGHIKLMQPFIWDRSLIHHIWACILPYSFEGYSLPLKMVLFIQKRYIFHCTHIKIYNFHEKLAIMKQTPRNFPWVLFLQTNTRTLFHQIYVPVKYFYNKFVCLTYLNYQYHHNFCQD